MLNKNHFKNFSLATLLLMLIMQDCFSQGTWTQLTDFPGSSRTNAVVFVIGSNAYIGTGRMNNSTNLSELWEFNGNTLTWTQKANYQHMVEFATGFSIGSKGYLGTGEDVLGNMNNYFAEYDPATNTWTQKASFPIGWEKAVGFSTGGKGYIGTGAESGGSSYKNSLYEYDPVADTWIQKNNTCNNIQRSKAVTFNINGVQYIGLGEKSSVLDYKDLWSYNPSLDSWTQKADYTGTGRRDASSFVIGNYAYVGLGWTYSNPKLDFYRYDPATNSWLQVTAFPGDERGGAACFSFNGKGYVMGGWLYSATHKDFWVFDPNGCNVNASFTASDTSVIAGATINFTNTTTNATTYSWIVNGTQFSTQQNSSYTFTNPGSYTVSLIATTTCSDTFSMNIAVAPLCWQSIAPYPGGSRRDCIAFSIGGKGYVGTGTSNFFDYKSDFYEYDPVTDVWTQKADINLGRRGASAFSIGSKGYVCAGYNGTVLNDLWEWNPANNTWTQKANFPGNARHLATAFAVNGLGYVGMGTHMAASQYFNDFYAYDPVANNWTTKASYTGLSRYGAVGLSAGGRGYSALGNDGINSTTEFYEYDPVADTWSQKTDFPGAGSLQGTGFSISSNIYLLVEATNFVSHFYMWEPASNAWTIQQDFPGAPRVGAVAFSVGSEGFVGTGEVTGLVSDFWRFSCGTTNIPNTPLETILVTNPVNDLLHITYTSGSFKEIFHFYELSGKLLFTKEINGDTDISIGELNDGVYLYSIGTGRNSIKGKIIKVSR